MTIELDDTAQPTADVALSRTATAAAGTVPPPAGPHALPPGKQLGHFQIVRKLGAGGMGEVYLATDMALDRVVALKVLPGGAGTAQARERLVREARAQARVQHPNVAHIYFIGEDEGLLYFAMEYVAGKTLAQLVEDKPLPPDDALALIHDAVLGLREAQRSGFTHRDVKPSNLMVDGHGIVKVLDFGIAAGGPSTGVVGAETGSVAVTQTSLAGTPLYMAPEQARGEAVDFRADIYALGATLFQLTTGLPPFRADTLAELRTLHETAPRPQLPKGTVSRTASSVLHALIARMMAPRPEDRFASYDELLRAIENTSSHYTMPAGFVARAIAQGLNTFIAFAVLSGLLSLATGDAVAQAVRMPLLALLELVMIARYGTTPGGAAFEIEIVGANTGARPTWRQILRRVVALYGSFTLFDVASQVIVWADLGKLPYQLLSIAWAINILVLGVHLLYTSATSKTKRTVWDRWSGTLVRYRTSRRR